MDLCPDGCPCPDGNYNCTEYTTTKLETTTIGPSTPPTTDDPSFFDDTAGILDTNGMINFTFCLTFITHNCFSGPYLNGDCYDNFMSEADGYCQRLVAFYPGNNNNGVKDCIDECSKAKLKQFTYAAINSNGCWCGNTPPLKRSNACTRTCENNEVCGGTGNISSFFSIPNQS